MKTRLKFSEKQIVPWQEFADQERGDESECRVAQALDILIRDGEIRSYIRSEQYDQYDRFGIDFMVFLEADTCVPLQVKSSQTGLENHLWVKRSEIPCIIAHRHLSPEMLAEELKKVLGIWVEPLRQAIPELDYEELNATIGDMVS